MVSYGQFNAVVSYGRSLLPYYHEVPFGKTYEWHNAHLALECECGEKVTLVALPAP